MKLKPVPQYPDIMRLKVLRRHINRAIMDLAGRSHASAPWYCPISQAIKERFGKVPMVGGRTAFLSPNVEFRLGEDAATFVDVFDRTYEAKPATVTLYRVR